MQTDLYQEITDQIMAMLDKGVVPWRSPIIRGGAGHPRNLESGKSYRGVNVFLLAFTAYAQGFRSSHWLTFNQAKARGGSVKKGEKSSIVVFWKQYEVKDRKTGEDTTIPLLRYYRVFNVDQCEGIVAPDVPACIPTEFQAIDAADAVVKRYKDGPEIEYAGTQPSYCPRTDKVRMPEASRFTSPQEFFSTICHELAHSTGSSNRLDRGLDLNIQPFGSPDYSKEELVAEMAAAFLCGRAGIHPAVIENQAAYIQGWLNRLKNDKKLVITAAGAAQKAAAWICGEKELPHGVCMDLANINEGFDPK
jgi:antirestriction protein ArdC